LIFINKAVDFLVKKTDIKIKVMFYIVLILSNSLLLNVYLAYKLNSTKEKIIDERVKNKAMREYLGSKN
jgi:hypothetical protein